MIDDHFLDPISMAAGDEAADEASGSTGRGPARQENYKSSPSRTPPFSINQKRKLRKQRQGKKSSQSPLPLTRDTKGTNPSENNKVNKGKYLFVRTCGYTTTSAYRPTVFEFWPPGGNHGGDCGCSLASAGIGRGRRSA